MKTLFLLIVLTQNGAGDINASFVNTQTPEQCQQKSLMVHGIFQASDIPVIESRCLKSNLRFSEFGHAASSGMIRNFYLVEFKDEAVSVEAVPDWNTCMSPGNLGMASGKLYCASSVQSLEN